MKAVSIYGPPGTGKTETLIREARSLLSKGPIKFLSHTKAAAEECVSRIGNREIGSTIHALCFKYLNVGRTSVVTEQKLQGFSDEIGIPITGASDVNSQVAGDAYLTVINYARNIGADPQECFDRMGRPGNFGEFKVFSQAYKDWKKAYGFVDFNDMLDTFLAKSISVDFKILLVDEAQDLSPLQWRVVDHLTGQMDEVWIAGDDDQTIYEWGGADSQGMSRFDEKYHADRRILSQSFRVPKRVHSLAQAVVHRIEKRVEKKYAPRDAEGHVHYMHSVDSLNFHGRVTVLARDSFKIKEVERILVSQKVPYEIKGAHGLLNKPYGRAMIVFRKLEAGETISDSERMTLFKSCDEIAKRMVTLNDFPALLRRGWVRSIPMPMSSLDYFSEVDLTKPPLVTLSTVHGAKGTEADVIGLYTSRSNRVVLAEEDDPDQEHRLWYVGVTRAKEELIVIDGQDSYNIPL